MAESDRLGFRASGVLLTDDDSTPVTILTFTTSDIPVNTRGCVEITICQLKIDGGQTVACKLAFPIENNGSQVTSEYIGDSINNFYVWDNVGPPLGNFTLVESSGSLLAQITGLLVGDIYHVFWVDVNLAEISVGA